MPTGVAHRNRGRSPDDTSRNEPIAVELRPWSEGDFALLQSLLGDPAMTVHLGGPKTPEEIRERHERYLRSSESGQGPMFAIVVGQKHIAAGLIGYWEHVSGGQHVWESGWSVLPEFQGKGVATSAVTLVVERARAAGKFRFLHAFAALANEASNAVCRKAGFTLQGTMDLEDPPGPSMRCNDWRLDLFEAVSED